MPFPKFEIAKYPPRQWAGAGLPGCGKSAFLTAMRGPHLVIDADQRFDQTLRKLKERGITIQAHRLSTDRQDNTSPLRIGELLDANMPGATIGTISVDSLTTIIAPRVTRAMLRKKEGEEKNQMAGFTDKALAMRMLQDSVTKWGTDCFWIWHLQEGRDEQASKVVTETLSKTERARLFRSLNVRLHFTEDKGRRGVKVVWARDGRAGMTLWDEPDNFWRGMPERIEAAVYDGLSVEDRQRLEKDPPELFPDEETAIAWGMDRGPFRVIEHARNAWDKLKADAGYTTLSGGQMAEMTALWVADIERRLELAEKEVETNAKAMPKPAVPPIQQVITRPADLPGIRKLLAGWEAKHAGDAVLSKTGLERLRELVLGHLTKQLHGDDLRNVLVEIAYPDVRDPSQLSQGQLSALMEWMAFHSEGVNGNRYYMPTPDTEVFRQEAKFLIDGYYLAHPPQGQNQLGL